MDHVSCDSAKKAKLGSSAKENCTSSGNRIGGMNMERKADNRSNTSLLVRIWGIIM